MTRENFIIIDDDGQEHLLNRPLREIERESMSVRQPARRRPTR